jgi:hypothetical protein
MATNGNAPAYGEAVERAICKAYDLAYRDNHHADARTDDGRMVQIKGVQRWVKNGCNERTRGQITVWSETLLSLLDQDGVYVLAIYDPEAHDLDDDPEDADPDALLEHVEWVDPRKVGAVARDYFAPAHRPSKGERAQFSWAKVLTTDSHTDGAHTPQEGAA